ncbi:recombinase family protein [Virgibacillus sp. NKC19-3]|uniref:recombinase family protein n=1 Tax=Virgibacillus saliphilus TaxID=2831674 RepID=UPI001C9AD2B7|nr:recombinase family protein [Virgibacillus sp. NKC19-3]MBY7141771.1 recombinase family protein [Virgibacillus sp. NKC19-3]
MIRANNYTKAPNQNKVWKVAIYIRLSRDDGNDESLSVTNQRMIIHDYLENSFDSEYTVVNHYIDDGLSGTTDYERIAFQQMISDMEAGKIDCIMCKTLSRAFRNYSDQGYFLERVFPLHGVRFISLGDPTVDTFLNPEVVQGMEIPMSGIMNDRYSAKISNDVRRTFDTKRRKGEFIGAFAPYGYKKNPENKTHLIIDEEAAQVVRNIFHWFVYDGMSKSGIVKHLNSLGILTPTNYKHSKGLNLKTPNHHKNDGLWGVNTVSRILKNPMYIGTMVQGKQRTISYKVHDKVQPSEDEWYVVENTHEPIIDKSIFDLAQNLMKRNTRTAPSKRHVHTFSGFLKCADCGMSMARKTTRRNTKKFGVRELVRYICSTFSQKSKDKCTNHTIKLEELNEAVLRAIQVQIALVDDMAAVIKEINKQPVIQIQSKQLKQLLETKKQELEKVTNVTDNLYVDWKSGDITKQEYIRMKSKFEQQANELKENIRNVESEIAVSQKGVSITDSYLTTFLKHKNIQTLERGLLLELVDIIYIHENKKITIKFNFEDQHKRMLEFIQQNKKATHDNKNQVM